MHFHNYHLSKISIRCFNIIYLCAFIILCTFTSCKKSNSSYVHFSDVDMVTTSMNNLPTIYVDGRLYTGELWSNDNRTMCMVVKDGQVETFILYHMNGKIANIQYGNGNGNNFDEFGNTLTEIELENKYPYLREATERILEQEIMPNIKLL